MGRVEYWVLKAHELDGVTNIAKVVAACYVACHWQNDGLGVLVAKKSEQASGRTYVCVYVTYAYPSWYIISIREQSR